MSILKLKPACKDYLWGGRRLVTDFHKEYEGERLAETWELSCHPDGPSRIAEGAFEGKTLEEYIQVMGKEVLGRNCGKFREFPVLIKLIDARENLSVQVHPDDAYALEHEGQYGKTEMWYVADCEEGAFLYCGFAREVDREELKKRIEEETLPEILNRVTVRRGDVLFIEAGTIHAIGKGMVIAEIQQNSNVTYRVYDYGRRDRDGKKRELHIEKALDVTDRSLRKETVTKAPCLARCGCFTVDRLDLDGRVMKRADGLVAEDSFAHILVLEGEGRISCGEETLSFRKGDSLFLPAGSGRIRIEGCCEALVTTVE